MTDETDVDRGRAFRALGWHESWGLDDLSTSDRNEVESIAAALAEERAKARAPFLALAEKWESDAQRSDDAEPVSSDGLTRMILAARFLRMNASDIRRAAEETQ